MTVLETTLVFLGIPLAVMGVLALLTLGVGGSGRTPRYRPGRPYEFTPVWFLAAPPDAGSSAGQGALRPVRPEVRTLPALGVRRARAALTTTPPEQPAMRTSGPKGGARGNW